VWLWCGVVWCGDVAWLLWLLMAGVCCLVGA